MIDIYMAVDASCGIFYSLGLIIKEELDLVYSFISPQIHVGNDITYEWAWFHCCLGLL